VLYVDSVDAVDAALATATDLDGKVIVCLAESPARAEQFRERALHAHQATGVVAVHSVREERAFGKSIISYSPAARRSRGSQSDVPIEGRGEAPFAESFDRNIEVGTG
jgi:hypothetical protein